MAILCRTMSPMLLGLIAILNQTALGDLDLSLVSQDWGKANKDHSVDGHPLMVGGKSFSTGMGTHASSSLFVDLGAQATRFIAKVGIDDETQGKGSAEFQVWIDGKLKWTSGVMRAGDSAKSVNVDLTGGKLLWLYVDPADNGIDYDHADWLEASITSNGGFFVRAVPVPKEETMPIAMSDDTLLEINGPRVVGCSPGKPFLFLIPATGTITRYDVIGLPKGLKLDNKSGIISGQIQQSSDTVCLVSAKGPRGIVQRDLRIICGKHKLALTPPMGWNSWNVWGTSVDAKKIRDSATAFVTAGLAKYGYQYVNIDDAWEGGRDAQGNIQTNEKFGDMAALAKFVHGYGLKLGIYSSPGPKTCAGYEGTFQHEFQDAKSWADWGIDYVKYDWCSYGGIAKNDTLLELQKPYIHMRSALDDASRDIVFSLCQYGMGEVWKWGKAIGGNLWRTTGDITDTWGSMSTLGFGEADRSADVVPGGWNDPDMLVVGMLGWSSNPRPTRLTKNEQITHITLWSMAAAPLLIGCDLTKIDPFTKSVLCNPDVLAVDQDALGKAGQRKWKKGSLEVWTRPLATGQTAVALFNRGPFRSQISVNWRDLGLQANQMVRDCWLRKDLGTTQGGISRQVPGHGAMLFTVGKG